MKSKFAEIKARDIRQQLFELNNDYEEACLLVEVYQRIEKLALEGGSAHLRNRNLSILKSSQGDILKLRQKVGSLKLQILALKKQRSAMLKSAKKFAELKTREFRKVSLSGNA